MTIFNLIDTLARLFERLTKALIKSELIKLIVPIYIRRILKIIVNLSCLYFSIRLNISY